MTPESDLDAGVGCRPSAFAGLMLLAGALVVGGIGLWLVHNHSTGLALFYAAAPVSAVFGVIGGHLTVAWPLDLAAWVTAGVAAAAWTARRGGSLRRPVLVIAALALAYGFALSQFVEVARLA